MCMASHKYMTYRANVIMNFILNVEGPYYGPQLNWSFPCEKYDVSLCISSFVLLISSIRLNLNILKPREPPSRRFLGEYPRWKQ